METETKISAKEIVDGMTRGEWKSRKSEKDDIYHIETTSFNYEGNNIATLNEDLSNVAMNQEAIVRAVNNTWLKGIDPDAVPEMLAMLRELSNMPDTDIVSVNTFERILSIVKKAELK